MICSFRGSLSGEAAGMKANARVVERHFLRRGAALALFRGDGEHGGTDRFRHGGHAAAVGLGTVAALDFEHDVAVVDDHRGKVAVVARQ